MSIQAVAREAGVSVATVSRVFNLPDLVKAPTRERVLKVAAQLGYQANASARTLRTQRSRVLGVVLPTLLNPVFAECVSGIAQAAAQAGYSIIPVTTDYRLDEEQQAVRQLLARSVDGLILVVSSPATSPVMKQLKAAGVPYMLAYNRHARHPCVSVDSEAAVAQLVRELYQRGHRRIGMVSGQLAASDRAQQRCRGYQRGMADCKLSPLPVFEVPFVETAVTELAAFLQRPGRPSALVCSNDLLAIRTLRAAHVAGLQVPRDLSVAGFDGIELGCDITPVLCTVVQPNADIGRHSVRLLAQAIDSGSALTGKSSLLLPFAMRPGESVAAPLAQSA